MKNPFTTILFTILAFFAVATLVFGGLGITGVAAQSAIPGDTLYSIKTSIEQTRLSIAADAGDRAQLQLSFAEKRLDEISKLIAEGRAQEIETAVKAFEENIQGAITELEMVSTADPAQAAQLATEITAALTRYATTLTVLAASAPDSVKEDVIRALDTTQLAAGLDDNANDNINDNSDDDNANVNGDDSNDNSDDDNANVNGDDSNDNSDDDSNDSSYDDSNSNSDDDSNDSSYDDSNSNSDDDSNDNSDDDSNDSSYDDSNDNSDDDSNDSSYDDSSSSDDDNSTSNDDSSSSDDDSDDDSGNDSGSDDDDDKGSDD